MEVVRGTSAETVIPYTEKAFAMFEYPKVVKSDNGQWRNWKRELHKCLQTYTCTPHTSTQFTSYRLLFGRDPRTKLPELPHQSNHPDDETEHES